MSEDNITRVRRLTDGTFVRVLPDGTTRPLEEGKTDWARLAAMTEEEITANALSDPDNPPSTPEELKRFRRVPNLKEIRSKLHMTQEQFAESFDLPLGTIRDWEQGAKFPDTAARVLLHVIAKNPQAVLDAIGSR